MKAIKLILVFLIISVFGYGQVTLQDAGNSIEVLHGVETVKTFDKDGLTVETDGTNNVEFIETGGNPYLVYYNEVSIPSTANISDLMDTLAVWIASGGYILADGFVLNGDTTTDWSYFVDTATAQDIEGNKHFKDKAQIDTLSIGGNYEFPTTDGTADQILTTDGSGTVSFDTDIATQVDSILAAYGLDLWYGVQWDVTSLNPVVTQIGNSTYQTTLPVHTGIKYAVIKDDKTINYYLDESDFTKKANGEDSDLTGADGQAMMIIPKYYEKYEQDGDIVRYKVSPYSLSGFTATDSVAIALFEGSYTASGDTLQSVINDTAKTSQTRAQFRAAAARRGKGWSQLYYDAYRYLTMLYMVEYASWDTQDSLGAGASNASSSDWSTYNSYNPVFKTGKYVSYGAHTGSIVDTVPAFPSGTDTLFTQQAYYRGVENIFGHIYKFVDGINIYNKASQGSRAFISTTPASFSDSDSTANSYSLAGSLAETDGYITRFIYEHIFTSQVGGSSSTYMCDRYYTQYDADPNSGWRVARFGGALYDGSSGGLWYAYFHYSSGGSSATVGSRLCLKF